MKLVTSTAAITALVAASASIVSPANANQFRYCEPGTRCREFTNCYINDVAQPCAYGSGGAKLGAIIFDHGEFDIEWINSDFAYVQYGRNKEFKVTATASRDNGYVVYRLSNGVIVKYPDKPGRYNPIDGPRPTHR